MNPVRLGVIGTGALGRHHARILSGLDGVQLVGVVDANAEQAQAVSASTGAPWFTKHSELFGQVDAVVVAVPTTAHLAVARDFLLRGTACLVEKPLAHTLAEAQEIHELAQSQGVVLQVGHVERFNPVFGVACDRLGDPRYIRAERFSPYAFRSMDIGVVLDVMIHDIDLILAIVGSEPIACEAFGASLVGGHEDCVHARLRFENGCIADVAANRVSPVARRSMQVWSADVCTDIDFATRECVQYMQSAALRYGPPLANLASQPGVRIDQLRQEVFGNFIKINRPSVPTHDALTEELRSFVKCVVEGDTPAVDGRAAMRSMRTADSIMKCVARHQWDASPTGRVGPFFEQQTAIRRAA